MLKNQKIHIFTGHYGSGKTEVALNFAIQAANKGEKVTIIDLDTVNPYFRTNDVKTLLQNHGISVIASEFASTNIDMPTVPATVLGVFETDGTIIFDVGGDDDGAYALGQYLRFFEDTDYQMHLVINSRRPLTATSKEMVDMAVNIQSASRLKITDIYNNTNLAKETDEDILLSGIDEIEKAAQVLGVEVAKHCGKEDVIRGIDPQKAFKMQIYIKMPFEN